MTLRIIADLMDLLDDPKIDGKTVASYLSQCGVSSIAVTKAAGVKGHTDFVKTIIPGKNGKSNSGTAPTLGIIGRLGGLGARPARLGFTSDGDGALSALAIAAKLGRMRTRGDVLTGDVIITTHVCPCAPTRMHEPVPFMDSPISSGECNALEIDPDMDAVLSIDTTKGNRIVNSKGIAITPTVKDGYILRVSEALLDIMEMTTGRLPVVLPITQQDITPYGNGLYHLNSILQPSVATTAPCVGVAITAQAQVAGCATGATHYEDVDEAVRFALEAAKAFTNGQCHFFDSEEFERIQHLYGSLSHFRRQGEPS